MGAFFIIYYILVLNMNFIRKLIIKTTWGPYWVMYDSECGLCYRITSFFKKLDIFDKIQWVDKNWDGDFPIEGRNKIDETVVVYNTSNNKLHYKSDAIFRIMLCVPFGFLFAWILKIPGLNIFFDWFYDKVSSSRKTIFKRNP